MYNNTIKYLEDKTYSALYFMCSLNLIYGKYVKVVVHMGIVKKSEDIYP